VRPGTGKWECGQGVRAAVLAAMLPRVLGREAAVGPGRQWVRFGKRLGSPGGTAAAALLWAVSDSIKTS